MKWSLVIQYLRLHWTGGDWVSVETKRKKHWFPSLIFLRTDLDSYDENKTSSLSDLSVTSLGGRNRGDLLNVFLLL